MDLPTRKEVLKKVKSRKKLVAAVFPVHYPRELLRAFDIHPMEVWGPPRVGIELSGKHLQSYVCSIIHNSLSFILGGNLKDVDLFLIPHSCDSLQGFGSLLTDFVKIDKPVLTFYIPRGKRKEDIHYLTEEIKRLYSELSMVTGKKPSGERLLEEIQKEEEVDELLKEVYMKHIKFKTDSVKFYQTLRLREYLEIEDFKKKLNNLSARHENNFEIVRVPLLFSGVLPEPMEILQLVEDVGGVIINDDFLSIKRRIYGKGKSFDPFCRMSERLLSGVPDSTKGCTFDEKITYLKGLINESGAKGFVFYNIKFCEPESFYYPIVKEELKKMNIISTSVEIDLNEGLSEKIRTKVETLIESIKG